MIEYVAGEVTDETAAGDGAAVQDGAAVGDGGWSALRAKAAAAGRRRGRTAEDAAGSVQWPEFAPPVGVAAGPLGAVQAAEWEIARQSALRARAVAAFAASRPAGADRPQGVRGAMSAERWAARPELLRAVSEWAAPELSVALSISQPAAEALLERSLSLVHRLPGTLAALEAGALGAGHVFPMLEHVAPIADPRVRAEVEARLLRWCAGRVTTPAQLGQKARREVLKRDAQAAARRLGRALAGRGVSARAGRVAGLGAVEAVLSWPEARALVAALGAYADALPADPGDARSRGQKMADVLLDLVLRPGESGLPPVQVALTVVAPVGTVLGGDTPGEVDGQVVPAEMLRTLLRALTDPPETAPAADDPPAPQSAASEPAGSPGTAPGEPDAGEFGPPLEDGTGRPLSLPERLALERYWAELEARIMADELLGPDPWPAEAEWAAWAAQLEPWRAEDPALWEEWAARAGQPRPDHPGDFDDGDADGGGDFNYAGEFDGDGGFDEAGDLSDPGDGPRSPADRDGWWAAADAAVTLAGEAVHEAGLALGRARALVGTAERADAAEQAAWQTSPAGRVHTAPDAVAALAAADRRQRAALADLLTRTGGGGLTDRPRLALVDALSGALVSLTDLPGLRRAAHCGAPACTRRPDRCTHDLRARPGLGAPPPPDGYRPAAALDRHVRARDRRCRMPGCRRRVPRTGELDHNRRYPDGPTAAANLTGYCTSDHRGKHQAPGWHHSLAPDGTLTVTTPTGLTAVTTPPPY